MPELTNYTPFPNFRYYSRDNADNEFGIVIVKGTFELDDNGELVLSEEQAPMVFTDKCHGDVNVTSLWHPSDLVPNKPATDVILNAVSHAPEGTPSGQWLCGVNITDGEDTRLEKTLRVSGPRVWQPQWKQEPDENEGEERLSQTDGFEQWEMTEPEPITELPLHYEFSFGGESEAGKDDDGNPIIDTDHCNPLGCGKMDKNGTDHTLPVAVPQIECPDDLITEPYKTHAPQGLGPIPPAWLPRRPLGGTYDQNWMDNIWPNWPADYDFSYHNSAHPDLIVKPWLEGTERVILVGLSEGTKRVEFDLPALTVFAECIREEEGAEADRLQMVLDTVFLDIAAKDRKDWRVFLSWRVNFEPEVYDGIAIFLQGGRDIPPEEVIETELENV